MANGDVNVLKKKKTANPINMIRMIKPLLGSFAGGRTGRPTILMIMQTRID